MRASAKTAVAAIPEIVVPRSFIKWVGGKRGLVGELLLHVPKTFGRYFEPCAGTAALFRALVAHGLLRGGAVLTDTSEELIRATTAVRDDVQGVIEALRRYVAERAPILHDQAALRAHFERVRLIRWQDLPDSEVAARMIFLNFTCYNGLFRISRIGEFNSSFGDYDDPTILDEPRLLACSHALRGAELATADFGEVCGVPRLTLLGSAYGGPKPEEGDLVYLDPPYVPQPGKTSFVAYTAEGFSGFDHARVAQAFRSLARRGVHVIATNSDTERTRRLYEGFAMVQTTRSGSVNSDTSKRQPVRELIITSKGV